MRSVASFLLFAIVRTLVVGRQVRAAPEKSGGLGHAATSLCAELIIPNGYYCIEHQAVTGDGFILGLQNIPSPRGIETPSYGRPVVLQHGLSAGGDNFVDNGPQKSLAFILADAGFDVWIANSRTIQWSHGHEFLFPDESAYWAWTYDELASFDLLAVTEFVSSARGGMQIGYIGHSLGTTIIFAGLTGGRFRNEILGHLNAVVLLAPIALSSHQTAALLVNATLAYSTLDPEITPATEYDTYNETLAACGFPVVNPQVCYNVFTATYGPESYFDPSFLSFYIQYFPQPTSTYNLNHLGQGYVRDNFAFYDEGTKDNLAKYGQATPPNYDLTTFPACLPVQYWTGGIDAVADPIDAAAILAKLPSSNREVNTLSNYGHIDFILGTHAYIDIYPNIITYLNKHNVPIFCPPP